MSEVKYPVSGACQCGGVTFELLAAPDKVVACHCKQCQKLSTAPFSVTAMVPRDNLKFSGEMKEWERGSDSGARNAARFCPTCGNRIYHYNPDAPEIIKLKAAMSLEDTSMLEPAVHVWTSAKADWDEVPEGVAQLETQP